LGPGCTQIGQHADNQDDTWRAVTGAAPAAVSFGWKNVTF
jgi:hypothetical protein